MSHKTLLTPLMGWMRICLRLGIAAMILLSVISPVGMAQAVERMETSPAGLQKSVDTLGAPPNAHVHPASMTADAPMQVSPPPMSVRYPERYSPPYPPAKEIERDLFSFEKIGRAHV